ncbi:unnamed protein product [Parnassius mnemosyne]|uniref:Translation initiation factor eIF2B subunit delta n=1 Tax=Parnassius mnemosyne TaxID=213953 RepID=A0AAV1M5K7_9NEOP
MHTHSFIIRIYLLQDLDFKEEKEQNSNLSSSKKRRLRRKKLWAARNAHVIKSKTISNTKIVQSSALNPPTSIPLRSVREEFYSAAVNGVSNVSKNIAYVSHVDSFISNLEKEMSSKDFSKSREGVLAAREAKKLSKQKAKKTSETPQEEKIVLHDSQIQSVQNEELLNKSNVHESEQSTEKLNTNTSLKTKSDNEDNKHEQKLTNTPLKGKDEVDRAIKEENKIQTDKVIKEYKKEDVSVLQIDSKNKDNTESASTLEHVAKSKEQIKAERNARKAAKQAKKKTGDCEGPIENNKKSTDINIVPVKIESSNVEESKVSDNKNKVIDTPIEQELTVRDVVETLKDIVNVAKEVQAVTDKVKAIDFGGKKSEETTKSKAELRAERRAKQEAQRAAKQAQQKPSATKDKDEKEPKEKQKQSSKPKSVEKPKPKTQSMHRVNWFQHLYTEHDKEALKKIALNSNLHPAVIKLGVQLASQVVTGSNARCIALLDALKKMVRDYSLPAKTEFARGLESHLAASLEFLWAMRQPSASQTNAVKHFRRQLTQLPNNVDEFDAKKTLQEEIDRYIREQIDMAGEAISIAVRYKISNGDNILTYGCSSLIERILCEAWASGVQFRAVVVGGRVRRGAREMLRRLAARALPVTYADITAVSFLMPHMNKVILGAGSLLVNGSVLGAVGSAQVALVARSCNVPVLVACETHKFCERVQTDAFVYNELGDPDDLIDKTDENSPLKDWRSNPNLTLLNLTYDVTPPSLVTAVVTELAILPCTSAPVVLRFKLSEYGM